MAPILPNLPQSASAGPALPGLRLPTSPTAPAKGPLPGLRLPNTPAPAPAPEPVAEVPTAEEVAPATAEVQPVAEAVAEAQPVEEVKDVENKEEQTKRSHKEQVAASNAARNAAVARLRDAHREEYDRYYEEECAARGVNTAKSRKAKRIEALKAELAKLVGEEDAA